MRRSISRYGGVFTGDRKLWFFNAGPCFGMCRTEVLVLVEVFGFIIFALSACYTYCVWRRIPFAAAANLNTGMMAVKANGRIFIMAYVSVALLWGEYLRIS